MDILNTECESDSNKDSTDLDVFRNVQKIHLMQRHDVINSTD